MFTYTLSEKNRHNRPILLTITFCILFSASFIFAENRITQVDTLLWNGDPMTHIQLVITNDGYTASELEQWTKDIHTPCTDLSESSDCGEARQAFDKIFSTSPFKEYKDFYNVIVISTESNSSGIGDQDDSSFDSFYGIYESGFQGMSAGKRTTFDNTITQYGGQAKGIIVISNYQERAFGFTDGNITFQTTGISYPNVVVHELGHSLGALTDTYMLARVYESGNSTANATEVQAPWYSWIGTTYNNGQDTVGMYEEMGMLYKKFYKPCKTDYMNTALSEVFCPPTQAALIGRFHMLAFNLIDDFSPARGTIPITTPSTVFSGNVKTPQPNTMKVTWTLNNTIISNEQAEAISICVNQLSTGTNTLRMKAVDTTQAMKKSYRWGLTYSWTLQYNGGLNSDECTQPSSSSSIIESSSIEASSSSVIISSSSVETPVSSARVSSSSVETPVSSARVSSSSVETPVSSEIVSSSSIETPASSEITSSSSVETPVSSEITSSSSVETPVSSEIVSSSSIETPVSSEIVSSSSIETPASSEITSSSSVETPVSSEIVSSSSIETPVSSEIVSSSSIETPASSEITSSSSVETPVSSEIVSSSSIETPVSSSAHLIPMSSHTLSSRSSIESGFIDEETTIIPDETIGGFIPFFPPPPQLSSSTTPDNTMPSSYTDEYSSELNLSSSSALYDENSEKEISSSSVIVYPAPPEETAALTYKKNTPAYAATLFNGSQLHQEIIVPPGATTLTLLNLNGTHIRTTSAHTPNLRGIAESRVYIITFQ
ncbi:MAG: M64 family metallopeptidase [Fibrobacterales bacterium]